MPTTPYMLEVTEGRVRFKRVISKRADRSGYTINLPSFIRVPEHREVLVEYDVTNNKIEIFLG